MQLFVQSSAMREQQSGLDRKINYTEEFINKEEVKKSVTRYVEFPPVKVRSHIIPQRLKLRFSYYSHISRPFFYAYFSVVGVYLGARAIKTLRGDMPYFNNFSYEVARRKGNLEGEFLEKEDDFIDTARPWQDLGNRIGQLVSDQFSRMKFWKNEE